MFDERQFIARVEAAEPEEYARILAYPSQEEERALRVYLGDARFERQQVLASRGEARSRAEKRGNVVVIHGIMGGELTAYDRKADADRLWVHLPRLIMGALGRMRLAADGVTPHDARWDVRATGILKRSYGDQLLRLAEDWNVRAYWYDWRKDLRKAADHLHASIDDWFGRDQPVHLVAHSMGGLVSRAFIRRHPERWQRMWDEAGDGRSGGRLIMLGTPNHGSFAVPQIITGLEKMVRLLSKADIRHRLPEVLRIVRTFPGPYQMLPSPFVLPEMEPLYRSETWGGPDAVSQRHLSDAQAFHDELREVVDPARMVYVAGYDRLTLCGLEALRVDDPDAYVITPDGDGRVPHALGLLDGVPTYWVAEDHGSLPGNDAVLGAGTELLETGATTGLPAERPKSRALRTQKAQREARAREQAERARDENTVELYVRRQSVRGESAAERPLLSEDERRVEEILVRSWLGGAVEEIPVAGPGVGEIVEGLELGAPPVPLVVDVVAGDLQQADELMTHPADAIAVGHYEGVRPQFAERALDEVISRALLGLDADAAIPDPDLLITAYTERGTIRGELGQPFLLPDPRRPGRLVVLAGMGLPGRFGAPELSVLARELAWALGRLGKKHLCTVLIGAGAGNLGTAEAVSAWLRGLQYALAGAARSGADRRIERITFIERDPGRVIELDRAIQDQAGWYDRGAPLDIVYEPIGQERLAELEEHAIQDRIRRAREAPSPTRDDEPTRVTLGMERQDRRAVYRFGAITRSASVPEREVPLDPTLVDEANNELPAMGRVADQIRRGQFLERLLVPRDLRAAMSTDAPLVMLLDAATARIHWEMVAQPDIVPSLRNGEPDVEGCFLATSRGFTRQLRTTFARVPEAPPPTRRPLRVLIIADPADDARLPGAMREGEELRRMFDGFNQLYAEAPRRVEVRSLLGPYEATRTAVLDELFSRQYDVLHFAGHCVYDEVDPAASGWIFTDGGRLSAHELRRVDRIPKFVFSNACESGITPDRSEKRHAALAPSFAEAFFERGVANFVCTAWPVNDAAALGFAHQLYAALLGLPDPEDPSGRKRTPATMHEAMRTARVAVARMGTGARSWGAYQHYGNPFFRFFEADALRPRTGTAATAARSSGRRGGRGGRR